jgi:hypothetical protein
MSFGVGTIVYVNDEQYRVISTGLISCYISPIEHDPDKVIWVMHEDLIKSDGKFILDTSKYIIDNR